MKKPWVLSYALSISEDSDQSGRMPRLIRIFAGCKGQFVGFVVQQLIYFLHLIYQNYISPSIVWNFPSKNAELVPLFFQSFSYLSISLPNVSLHAYNGSNKFLNFFYLASMGLQLFLFFTENLTNTESQVKWRGKKKLWFLENYLSMCFYNWPTSWENLFMACANNKGTDQPVRLLSLISAFVVHCLEYLYLLNQKFQDSGLLL